MAQQPSSQRVSGIEPLVEWNDHETGVAQAREEGAAEVIARIRREAGETFDMSLDHELRSLADLIEQERARP